MIKSGFMFNIWFANENYSPELVALKANNADEAIILAKAERIKEGKDYTLHSIGSPYK